MPTADAMLLIDDFEYWAEKVLSGTAWNYYKSAADREISKLHPPFRNIFSQHRREYIERLLTS
jgi:hypothetical protein